MKLYREGARGVKGISGSLLFVENLPGAGYGETVTIESPAGTYTGRILRAGDDFCVIRTFGETVGPETGNTVVWLERDVLKIGVGEILRGRILNGRGQPIEGENLCGFEEFRPVGMSPINPAARNVSRATVETGISAVDLMMAPVLGQSLSLFAGPGLPTTELAAWIARNAKISGDGGVAWGDRNFMVVFVAAGITGREADCFIDAFQAADPDSTENGICFLNTAGDSSAECLLTPRVALTVAEYFAFVRGYDVLVVMADMLHYCDALQGTEIIYGNGGPDARISGCFGDMYSELAAIYERSGCIAGLPGSLTQLSVVSMPNDDITHPVADLCGSLADGRFVLDRRLHKMNIFPPTDVLSSVSRSIKSDPENRVFDSRRLLAEQLRTAYAGAVDARRLRLDAGDKGLSGRDRQYLRFGERFESLFLDQKGKRRTLAESEAIAMEVLGELPVSELYLLPRAVRDRISEAH